MEQIRFLDENGTFQMDMPENYSNLYFPIAGEKGLKGCVTPNLGGDSKVDQESFLLEPVSVENLHNNRSTRNFWCKTAAGAWSVTGVSAEQEAEKFTDAQDKSSITAGFMWHSVRRESKKYQIEGEILSFVPANENVEILWAKLKNNAKTAQEITPVAAVPIYGRSADNIRDHRNVTSMLHRIRTTDCGILVKPTMSFDEKGHRRNEKTYFVAGMAADGEKPTAFYPTVEGYIGEGGTFTHPQAVYGEADGVSAGTEIAGKEAMGAFCFAPKTLAPGETAEYIVLIGITDQNEAAKEVERLIALLGTSDAAEQALEATKVYWQNKVGVRYHTGDKRFDQFLNWVSFQPYLRYVYGCSFLPYHDYGRGGRGWRDLWQDCLALLLVNPDGIRQVMADNYGGVRIDGSNATIIGSRQGEFIADRNGISRVWMDHGLWPFMTTKLYMDQTGDYQFLLEKASYFKDAQSHRGVSIDTDWSPESGMKLKTADGAVYEGTVLEHILIEQLCSFYEVGSHNIMRLRGADWNDALDMAEENGESVAFTCAYAGNLRQLADCLRLLKERFSCGQLILAKECELLLADDTALYDVAEEKRGLLQRYLDLCAHTLSGETIAVSADALIENLEHKADWLMQHIRKQEWIQADAQEGWFNSYYDNSKNRVEGMTGTGVRMMLTGQVFAVMSGTASEEQIEQITKSADHYLYDKSIGGYRLNTDFKELKFDMGRMFGFAYGEKENGAVFSHMTVMYANALYQRGFVKAGYKALQSLADTALDFDTSRMYPGIPEYFNSDGRGLYPYLTGAASWYMLTMLTAVFGVHGEAGDLIICPKLLDKQFDETGRAFVTVRFAEKDLEVLYVNEKRLSYGDYQIVKAECGGTELAVTADRVVMKRQEVQALSDGIHKITVTLSARS